MNDPLIGQQLGNYRIERLIGRGGMAQVYYGHDTKLQRPVAIKVIDSHYRDITAYAQRFVKEARMMAKWRHENIIQIYYAGEEAGVSYYAMELINGDDLATVMSFYNEEKTLMPIPDIIRIGRAVANALDYAHKEGIIHRDVKPSNVLIARDGRVVLGDFGMALEQQMGSIGEAFGTPHYISPEQARRSSDAVPQSDLYSLGVILYEILTGMVPFTDPSPASIALQHITDMPPSPRSINPDLNEEVEYVLLKILEKEPEKRYKSGAELMNSLEKALLITDPSQKIPLPPLPVGVPTVRRSAVSIDMITKRGVKTPSQMKIRPDSGERTVLSTATKREILKDFEEKEQKIEQKNEKKRKKSIFFAIIPLLAIIAFGAWFFFGRGISPNFAPPTAEKTTPTAVTSTSEAVSTPILTVTDASIPVVPPTMVASTETQEVTATLSVATVTETMTEVQTEAIDASPVPSSGVTETATAAVVTTPVSAQPTIKYPDGNHFTLFYNESSLHLLNRSRAIRGVNGFSFERLDAQGAAMESFKGFFWEANFAQGKLPNILPKYCVSIKIYDSAISYIDPPECRGGYLSTFQPKQDEDRAMLFWTPKEGTHEFRVVWSGEEVARCEISAGVCEAYIP